MKNAVLAIAALAAAVQTPVLAQSTEPPASSYIAVSPNRNVLRGINDPFRGDPLLQRQNEPAAAVSTRNPNHIMVAANDYRTVDMAGDIGMGESLTRVARRFAHGVTELMARLTGRKEFVDGDEAIEKAEAGAEAWIGIYLSNDGGRSYSTYLMPGYPLDTSATGQATPIFGRQAASDPVLAAAPAGRFYLGAMAFDRDPVTKEPTYSQIAVSRFTDRNNSETGLNFHFDGMTLVDNGSVPGRKFLDKPAIAADIARTSADPAACGPVYIAFTVFDTGAKDPMQRSKILFSRSLDCGATFSPATNIAHRSLLNQGVALAIRPADGAVFATYRSFSENKIYLTSSTDGGISFSAPQVISGSTPILAFDQPSLTRADGYAFRTNAMPTLAIDGGGRIFVAWQERLANDANPRIVITSSADGRTWAAKQPVEPCRYRADASGALTCDPNEVGPQVIPSLSFTRGKLMLLFYEARPYYDAVKFVPSQNAAYITGLDVQLAVRVAQIDASGHGASVLVTQYDRDGSGNVIPVLTPDGQYRGVNRPNLPMYAGGTTPFMGDYLAFAPTMPFVPSSAPQPASWNQGQGNAYGAARNGGGPAAPGPAWRWATDPTDGPSASFVAAWGDNRDVVFPSATDPASHLPTGPPRIDGDWTNYAAPGSGYASCVNPGSRNANVYASLVSPRLFAGTPTSFKQIGIQRAFVLFVQNQTADNKFYRLTIAPAAGVTASFLQFGPPQTTLDVQVFPLSSIAQNVFAIGANNTVATQPFRVDIQEITAQLGSVVPDGDGASVLFNGDPSNPTLIVNDPNSEVHAPRIFNPLDPTKTTPLITNPQVSNPQVSNPQVSNPQVSNPQVSNPQVSNPQVSNPQVSNPQVSNVPLADGQSTGVYGNVTNYTWQVTNGGNTASAFTPILNIANQAALENKKVTLYIYKTYSVPTFIPIRGVCTLVQMPHDEIISIVQNPQVSNPQVSNPQVSNPQVSNPQVSNPQVSNPQVSNSTFFVSPTDSSVSAAGTTASLRRPGGITLAAYQTSPPPAGDTSTLTITDAPTFVTLSVQDGTTPTPGAPAPQPPLTTDDFTSGGSAVAVTATSTDVLNGVVQAIPDAATTGPDLAIAAPPTFSVASGATVPAGTVVTIGSTTVQNIGQQATGGPFAYGFYLSATPQIDPTTATLLGSGTYEASIDAGGTATIAGGSFAVPPSTAPGTYYFGIRINSGMPHVFEPEGNDSATEPIAVVPGADLVITQAALTPSTLYAGQTTTAYVVVANAGTAPAAASTLTLTLSGGGSLASVATPALAAGAAAPLTTPLVIPNGTAAGTYTVTAIADATGAVPESNETDNSFGMALRVVNTPATLTFVQQPSTTMAGQPIVPPVTVQVAESNAPAAGVLVQLALIGGSGTLSGTTAATSDASGLASFPNLVVNRPGTAYQLAATAPTAGATTAILSSAFTITNAPPTATNDSYAGFENSALLVGAPGVLANDSDVDGDAITASVMTQPANGTLSLHQDGSFTYTPNASFAGTDTFTYVATDAASASSAPATVTIAVAPTGPANFVVVNTNDSGVGSLRQAILDSNANAGNVDTITFAIPGGGVQTIQPLSPLPAISDPAVVDASTAGGARTVAIDGAQAGAGADGLLITGGGTTIRGLVIGGFGGRGIFINGPGGNHVEDNYVGTTADGAAARGNLEGVLVAGPSPSNNVIGRSPLGRGNVISGNTQDGIRILAGVGGNVVEGNFVGTDATGATAIPNGANGVHLEKSTGTTVGGTETVNRNVVSGNAQHGIFVDTCDLNGPNCTGNTVQGNYVGLNASGTAAVGNTWNGVMIWLSPNNVVRGNVVSGNGNDPTWANGDGIHLFSTDDTVADAELHYGNNVVAGNLIGTDASGAIGIGNQRFGVTLNGPTKATIGGPNGAADRNVIAANGKSGVLVGWTQSPDNLVQGNYIGIAATGASALPNGTAQIDIGTGPNSGVSVRPDSPNNAIVGNVIAGNAGNGVSILSGSDGMTIQQNVFGLDPAQTISLPNSGNGVYIESSNNKVTSNVVANNGTIGVDVVAGVANTVSQNSIYANARLGIDLGGDGVTLNDSADADTGANQLQNYPVLAQALSGGGATTVTGTLNSAPSSAFHVEFFANSTADPSGYGQGQTYLGSTNVSTDGNGNASFEAFVSPVAAGFVTATATDAAGNTSEFAKDAAVTPNHPPTATSASYFSTENTPVATTLAGSDPDGDPITFSLVTHPAHGTLSGTAPNLTYTPANGYSGADSFAFDTSDGALTSSVATISITVTAVQSPDQAPVAVNDSYSTAINTSLTLTNLPGCVAPPSQIGWWRGNGDAFDSIAGANAVAFGALSYTSGEVGQAFTFNGQEFARAPFTYTGPFTIEFWVRTSSPFQPAFDSVVSSSLPADFTASFQIETDGNGNYRFDGPQSQPTPVVIGSIATNAFQHVAVTWDGQTLRTYLNGQASTSADWTGTTLSFTTLKLGINRNENAGFTGDVDEVSVFNRALAAGEIAAIFNAGAAGKCIGVLSNDQDVDSTSLTAAQVTQPQNGTVTFNSDGTFAYVPNSNFVGADSFTYKANDGSLDSAAATVSIAVTQPVQIDLSSLLNADVVMNTTDPQHAADAEKTAMDGSGYVLMTASYANAEVGTPAGLPDNGSFPSDGDHPAVQLYANNGGDARNVVANGPGSASYTIAVPNRSYNQVQVYAVSTEGSTGVTFTLHYADATTDTRSITVPDWVSGSPSTNEFYLGSGYRRHSISDGLDDFVTTAIFGLSLYPDPTKVLVSIDVSKPNTTSHLIVFAATGQ